MQTNQQEIICQRDVGQALEGQKFYSQYFQLSQQQAPVVSISPEIYLIMISLAALTVPATRHAFDHFLPFSCTTRDATYRGWERWVTRLPTHGLDLAGEEIWERHLDKGLRSVPYGVNLICFCRQSNIKTFVHSDGKTKHPRPSCGTLSHMKIGSHLLKLTLLRVLTVL